MEFVTRKEFDAGGAVGEIKSKKKRKAEGRTKTMSNPFMAALGGGSRAPMGNFPQMVQQFNQFKSNFKGRPQSGGRKALAEW